MTYTDAGVLVDADSTPTVAIRKNGTATVDVVTVTKRAATTGIYDCSYNPASEAEGDTFTVEETATISSQAYVNAWQIKVIAPERGTDSASTFDPATDTVANVTLVATTTTNTDMVSVSGLATQGDISSLNNFDPTNDVVANVTLVATTTTNTDMRGTDGANTTTPNTVVPDNTSIASILADTNELQSNQGDWATATGFNTVAPDNASIASILADTNELQSNQGDWATATGFNTVAPDNASIASILADTNELQSNQGDWATATGFATINPDNTSIAAILVDTADLQANQGDWATATGFATVNPDNASITAIKSKTDQLSFTVSNQVDSNSLSGGGSGGGDSKEDIYLHFTTSNREDVFKATGFATVNADNASIASILADTNELQQNQGDWLTATGFATVNPANASIASILADTHELQSNQGDWLTATGFATVNADNAGIAAIKAKTDSLTFTIANQVDANAVTGGGQPIGSGAISHTITVNIDGNPAPAVDAWVTTDSAGTNVVAGTLVTDNSGQVTFQLDAGSYYLWCQRSGVNFSNPTAFTVS